MRLVTGEIMKKLCVVRPKQMESDLSLFKSNVECLILLILSDPQQRKYFSDSLKNFNY